MKKNKLYDWDPENKLYWDDFGSYIANRNLICSIPCLLIAFCVWFIWSIITVKLNDTGFDFSNSQLFTLAAVPGLSGASLRIVYSFMVPIFGGRNWTIFSTLILLIPAIGVGLAVQDVNTSYAKMFILAMLCGLGGGNFSSSMSNIGSFFPKKQQGVALGLNAGLGNLGVSVLQFISPLIISMCIFSSFGGPPQHVIKSNVDIYIWLQNVSYIWVIPIILSSLSAFFWMDNLPTMNRSFKDQLVIFKRKHMYIVTWLYSMSFGSFIGYAAAFPLLIKTQFIDIDPLKYAFLGPMLGALCRPVGGWLSDKINSGSIITFIDIIIMILATYGVTYFISPSTKNFNYFFVMFIILFITTGIANGSIFRMIPQIFVPKESGTILGFCSAIAAFGAYFIPKSFSLSIHFTGNTVLAFNIFILYYAFCLFVVWWFYLRKESNIKC